MSRSAITTTRCISATHNNKIQITQKRIVNERCVFHFQQEVTNTMNKNFFKRGVAGLLSLVMCLTALVGFGTTTAFAAGEQADVYLISFPRSGDPPYVSLKNLSDSDRKKAIKRIESYSLTMPSNGSLWMPFVIHSTEMLATGGRLGFVLPYEITYVRYAFGLWNYLGHNYGKISIYRVHKDFFPDVDVETVIFLAEEKGSCTDDVSYCTLKDLNSLFEDDASLVAKISISDIVAMGKPFEKNLFQDLLQILLKT